MGQEMKRTKESIKQQKRQVPLWGNRSIHGGISTISRHAVALMPSLVIFCPLAVLRSVTMCQNTKHQVPGQIELILEELTLQDITRILEELTCK